MQKKKYDIIGDIHGCHDKLLLLLTALGYQLFDGCYRHPLGRKVAFLGDFIDPKGDIPHINHDFSAVLKTVKAMVENKEAVAVMGNHEFNAIAYATPDGKGDYLRPHKENKDKDLKITIKAFDGGFDGQEWKGWIEWFKTLPFFLELDGFRLVHAYWHEDDIANLKGKTLRDPEFLKAATKKGTPEFNWIENVLKGYEIPMPEGHSFIDSTGIERDQFRARWFERNPVGKSAKDLLFPAGSVEIPDERVPDETAALIPGYPASVPPAFFGHYFKPKNSPLKPELENLACLDFSVATGGPMVAYRWDGEAILNPDNYVAV